MRTLYCGELSEEHLSLDVTMCGWVHRRRDHGGVIFLDMRDYKGIGQVVFDPDTLEAFHTAEHVRNEFVLRIKGTVRKRPEGTENPEMPTGYMEVLGKELTILNTAITPPFQLDDQDVNEEVRLRYRYVDLRRPEMQLRLRLRAQITQAIRQFLDRHGFVDVETPMLTRATPEGARDYLVPSRTHGGAFFALPQSPQLFKQLLMMSGMDRYYQIVRCFRDEDLRADRQPEFTQLDIEASFMDEEELIRLMEELLRELFAKVLEIPLPNPMPRMSYAEAVRRFGTDRPDLRIPLELVDLGDVMQDVDFKVFAEPAKDPKGRVAALKVPGGNRLTRSQIDEYTRFVGIYGAKGLAYIKVNKAEKGREGLQSPILKFLPDEAVTAILSRTGAENGDLIFFGADKLGVVNESLGNLRLRLGEDLGLMEHGWKPVWIMEFPMFEWDENEKRWYAIHHPFTAPKVKDISELEAEPHSILSRAYDLVLNGAELGGGSIRIHDKDLQMAVFRLLDIQEEDAREKFGFLVDALTYGCPPHGGIAFGLDRLAMLMTGAGSIRDVIAFPKTQTATCPLTSAPAEVPEEQLRELGIRIRKPAAD